MKLTNETLADIVTVEVEYSREGNGWETGKHDVNPNGYPKIVTRGRTYSLKLTNARGDVWTGVNFSVGSGLTHDKKGKERHPSAEEILFSLTMDASAAEDYTAFEDFAADMGYDADSRKALDMYLECGRTHTNIMRMFTADERMKINEATEDM